VTALVDAAYRHYVERIGRPPRPMTDDYEQVIREWHVTVAEEDGEIVGVVAIGPTQEGFTVDNVAVHPSQQGKGLGRALLEHAETEARLAGCDAIYLYTHERMTENQALYARLGYEEYERRAEHGFSRVFMRKRLPYDRVLLLSEPKRNEVLSLEEVERYGHDGFGDPDYVSVYGMRPAEWYGRGVRLLARTVVECTRDALADAIGRDVAKVAPDARLVVDPFAGSANTLHWIARHTSAAEVVGFELDDRVFETTRRNLEITGLPVRLEHAAYEEELAGLSAARDETVVVFIAPPWGDALDSAAGLDLERTQPPVSAVVDLIDRSFAGSRVLLAIQIYETVSDASLSAIRARFAWSSLTVYGLSAPGQNHGLLMGTLGWAP
jgi:GNAT superfamily N-acetyltransferase